MKAAIICFVFVVSMQSVQLATIAIATTCTWNGQTYPAGPFNPDPCTFCHCEGGRPMCAVADCAPPSCVDYVHDPKQCCPVCPNGNNCRAPDGSIIPAGQTVQVDSTTTCTCPSGSGFFMQNAALCKTEQIHVIPEAPVVS